MNLIMEEDHDTLFREADAHVEVLKALEGEVVGLMEKFHASLQ